MTIDAITAEGDLVTVLHTHRGIRQAVLMHIPPTGRAISVDGLDLLRVRDGRLSRSGGTMTTAG